MHPSPRLEPVLITRKAIQTWRDTHGVPRAKLGIFFGVNTILWFPDGLDPLGFEYFPTEGIGDGFAILERAAVARRDFRDMVPDPSGIF